MNVNETLTSLIDSYGDGADGKRPNTSSMAAHLGA